MMQRLIAYLQLLRLPAVFTAMADVLMGYLCSHTLLSPWQQVLLLLASSSCLYLTGMVFNDVFDRRLDAIERPERPIPSGRVSVRAACTLGTCLVAIALACAFSVGRQSFVVGALLALLVLAYDGVLKKSPVGPVAMGGCRFLNVILGASAMPDAAAVWRLPQIHLAAALGVYVAGLTWLARREAVRSHKSQILGAAVTVNLGMALMAALLVHWPGTESWRSLLLLAAIAATVNIRLAIALLDPSPAKVQTAVQGLLGSIIMLDTTMVLFVTGRADYAILVAALLVPYAVLRRRISAT